MRAVVAMAGSLAAVLGFPLWHAPATAAAQSAAELQMRITKPDGSNIFSGRLRETKNPRDLGYAYVCLTDRSDLWLNSDDTPHGPRGEPYDVLVLSMCRHGDVGVFRIDAVQIACDASDDGERVANAPQYLIVEDTLGRGETRLVREVEPWGLSALQVSVADEVRPATATPN